MEYAMMRKLKSGFRQVCPPILLPVISRAYRGVAKGAVAATATMHHPSEQDLDIYWDPEMARILDTWGEGNVWTEIQLLLADRTGRVLDIACGTGKTMSFLTRFKDIELYGCDISDRLIDKAVERGIARDHLLVCDATQMPYDPKYFEYAYSIGSIEHFTEDGIHRFLQECRRVSGKASFHQNPVSRDGSNHGWIKTFQSYFNNSVDWWVDHYESVYPEVEVVDSRWEDDRSVGKWFICRG
jgi:SAM-dependent methyltransferase